MEIFNLNKETILNIDISWKEYTFFSTDPLHEDILCWWHKW